MHHLMYVTQSKRSQPTQSYLNNELPKRRLLSTLCKQNYACLDIIKEHVNCLLFNTV